MTPNRIEQPARNTASRKRRRRPDRSAWSLRPVALLGILALCGAPRQPASGAESGILFGWSAHPLEEAEPGPTARLRVRLRLAPEHWVMEKGLRFRVEPEEELALRRVQRPTPEPAEDPYEPDPIPAYSGEVEFLVVVAPVEEPAPEGREQEGTLIVQFQGFTQELEYLPAIERLPFRVTFAAGAEPPDAQPPPEAKPELGPHPATGPDPATGGAGDAAGEEPATGLEPEAPAPPGFLYLFCLAIGLGLGGLMPAAAHRKRGHRRGPDPADLVKERLRAGAAAGAATVLGAGIAGLLGWGLEILLGRRMPMLGPGPAAAIAWLTGLYYWGQRPCPPWIKGTAPAELPGSGRPLLGLAPALLGRAVALSWPAVTACLALALSLGARAVGLAAAGAALLLGLLSPWIAAGGGAHATRSPRYLTSVLGILLLTAAMYLSSLRFPVLRPPAIVPVALVLVSLILIVIGVMMGALDRPLLSRHPRTVAVKVLGSLFCIAGLFQLLVWLAPPAAH